MVAKIKWKKPSWYASKDVKATKQGWVYTKNHNEVLEAIANLITKLAQAGYVEEDSGESANNGNSNGSNTNPPVTETDWVFSGNDSITIDEFIDVGYTFYGRYSGSGAQPTITKITDKAGNVYDLSNFTIDYNRPNKSSGEVLVLLNTYKIITSDTTIILEGVYQNTKRTKELLVTVPPKNNL